MDKKKLKAAFEKRKVASASSYGAQDGDTKGPRKRARKRRIANEFRGLGWKKVNGTWQYYGGGS